MKFFVQDLLEKFKKEDLPTKIAYILITTLFVTMPFKGLVLETLGISFISYNVVEMLYYATVVSALSTRKYELVLITIVGFYMVLGATIFMSEVLRYYLLKIFGINTMYR